MHLINWVKSNRDKLAVWSLILFAISLPFNAIEWDIFSIARLEIKPTMVTFGIMLLIWIMNRRFSKRSFTKKDRCMYILLFLYGLSQFLSLINSPLPLESLKQGIIIVSLLFVMLVTSEIAPDKSGIEHVLVATGILSIVISIFVVVGVYFFENRAHISFINFGGDRFYFGDCLLLSTGGVFLVLFGLRKKSYLRWLVPILFFFWFSAVSLTFLKGLVLAVFLFIAALFFLSKEYRRFSAIAMGIFLAAITTNFVFYPSATTAQPTSRPLSMLGSSPAQVKEDRKEPEGKIESIKPETKLGNPALSGFIADYSEKIKTKIYSFNLHTGYSITIRQKAIRLSLIYSLEHFWFGHGAGLSQRLLPALADEYDRNVNIGQHEYHVMVHAGTYGHEANRSLIDSHIFFLTEFFNVGIAGLIPLLGIVIMVALEQFKTIILARGDNAVNVLLFLTLAAMLAYRFTGSLVVMPSLWFILGLNLGASKFNLKPDGV